MNLETFTEALRDACENKLRAIGNDADVSIKRVNKVNYSRVGIEIVKYEDDNARVSAVFYPDDIKDIADGNVDVAADVIIEKYLSNEAPKELHNSLLNNYDYIKPRLRIGVLNKELNEELVSTLVHRDVFDLSLFCYVIVHDDNDGCGIARVINELLNVWGVTREQLFNDAIENVLASDCINIKPFCDDEDDLSDVALSSAKIVGYGKAPFGAALCFDNRCLDRISKAVNLESMYIITMSTSDCVVLDANNFSDNDIMKFSMLCTALCIGSAPDKLLTVHAYKYDGSTITMIGEE